MQTEITMLGTGNAMVTKCYNTCFLIRNDNQIFMVDAGGGNGILAIMDKIEVSFECIHDLFLTHGHTDHILGAVWVIRKIATLMNNGKYEGDFRVYCHDVVKNMIETMCDMLLIPKMTRHIGERIQIIEVSNHTQKDICGMQVTFFDILSTKAKQFGFTAVTESGKKISCMGDEPFNESCRELVENSDLLMSEAFCLYEDRERFKPYEKHHSTAKDAGEVAEQLKAKSLLLYHTEDSDLKNRKQRYGKEAGEKFSGQVYVPEDLETIVIQG